MGLKPDLARAEHQFYFGVATFFGLLVFAGFARTYYFRSFFHMPAPTALIAFHAALMTGWILLFFVQAFLVSARRLAWHRQLGVVGVCWALLIVPIGCLATLTAAGREVRAHSKFIPMQLNVLGLELTQMSLFLGFVLAAVWFRGRPDYHKRLMVLATLCILPNALVRLSLWSNIRFLGSNLVLLTIWAFLVLCIVAVDRWRTERLHPAIGYGSGLAVLALYLALFGSLTAAWDHYWIRILG